MAINLGQDPNVLIALSFLEILFILIPALIAAKVEKTSFLYQINQMGFTKKEREWRFILRDALFGLTIAMGLFLIAGYISFFFKFILVSNFFGKDFVQSGTEGSISTIPIIPNIFQIITLILIQIFIIGPCEEGFFRSFIITKSQIKHSNVFSIFLSSLFFGLYHVPPFIVPITTIITNIGYYFTIGIALSLLYIYTNYSLLSCSACHSFFNILIYLF